ncbi:MAG: tetratricopeptide repeat protein [Pseudomonadota bacterium]
MRRLGPFGCALILGLMSLCSSPALLQAATLEEAEAAYAAGDYETAYELFLDLAEAGDPEAQFDLGVLYLRGDGVEQDAATGAAWLQKAADQGFANAQMNLGLMYQKGDGVPQDDAQAARLFEAAAAQGHAQAQNALGILFARGQGVLPDPAQAAALFGLAADQGHVIAQVNIAFAFEKGEGVPQDDVEAYRWLFIASQSLPSQTRTQVESWMEAISARMTPAQITAAEERAQAWFADR